MTDGSNDRIQYVVDSGAVPLLVRLLTQATLNVITPALRAVGNIVTGSDLQTDAVIEAGGIQAVGSLLIHEKMNVVKEAAWTISNITAGPPEQIQIIIGSGILPPLIEVLKNGDFRAKKEAAWAVTNLTSGKIKNSEKLVKSLKKNVNSQKIRECLFTLYSNSAKFFADFIFNFFFCKIFFSIIREIATVYQN